MINLKKLTSEESNILVIMRCALADLEGAMPIIDPCDDDHSGWETIADLKVGIAKLSGDITELWTELGDIPTTEEEEIDETFLHFPPGTNVHDIWYWFEETFDIRVGDVMNGK